MDIILLQMKGDWEMNKKVLDIINDANFEIDFIRTQINGIEDSLNHIQSALDAAKDILINLNEAILKTVSEQEEKEKQEEEGFWEQELFRQEQELEY